MHPTLPSPRRFQRSPLGLGRWELTLKKSHWGRFWGILMAYIFSSFFDAFLDRFFIDFPSQLGSIFASKIEENRLKIDAKMLSQVEIDLFIDF